MAGILASTVAVSAALGAGAWAATREAAHVPPVTVERDLLLMGTEAAITVIATDRDAALAASEEAVRALEATAARLSTWRADSELARLNAAPVDAPVALSPMLARELSTAARCAEATGGAFDPVIGALVDAWDLRGAGRVPSAMEIADAVAAARPSTLELASTTAARRNPRTRVEEGGWGKGAGVDAALAALAGAPRVSGAFLDLGGQSASLGDARWNATLADPRDRRRPVLALTLAGGSLSTSGNGEHGLVVEGRRIGHLLDPRTGSPAPDFGTLTVWAPTGFVADCLSTGLYVMGPDRALAWASAHPEVAVAVLETRGAALHLRATPNLLSRARPLVPDLDVD